MNQGHIYFKIQADDASRAIEFYSHVFGWRFSKADELPLALLANSHYRRFLDLDSTITRLGTRGRDFPNLARRFARECFVLVSVAIRHSHRPKTANFGVSEPHRFAYPRHSGEISAISAKRLLELRGRAVRQGIDGGIEVPNSRNSTAGGAGR